MYICFRRRSYAASTKTQHSPRSHYLEDHPPAGRSKRHSLGALPEAGKLESVLGLAALSARAKALSTDTDGTSPKTTETSNKEAPSIKYDENSNERTVDVEHSIGDTSPSSPKNKTVADVSDQALQPDVTQDTRSPAERSLAKLFGKRKALNREKVIDSSEHHLAAESANSPTPKTNVSVEVKSETEQSETKVQELEPPKEEVKKEEVQEVKQEGPNSGETSEVSSKLKETVAPQFHDKLQSVPDIVSDIKDSKVTVQSSKVEKREKEHSKTKDGKSEVKRKSAAPAVPTEGSPRPRSATHTGSTGSTSEKVRTKSDQKKPLTLSGIQALLRPRSSTYSGAARPQSVAEAPPRPPPRKHSKKRRQAPTAPGATAPTSPTSPSSPSKSDRAVLKKEEKASRRISSPPLLQTFNVEARSPSGSSTSSSSATPATSPSKPPRKPSRKKSPAPPPPLDIPPFGSVDNLGRYDQVRPPSSSLRRAGSLEDVLHNDENSPVPPPRIKRKQRMRLADIRGKSRSGSDNSGSDSPERRRRENPAHSHLPKGATTGQYDHLRQLELEMEARKRELERMRLKYAGHVPTDSHQSEVYLDLGGESSDFDDRREVTYQNVEFSSPLHAASSVSDTLKTVLRLDDDGHDDLSHDSNTNVEHSSTSLGLGAESQDRQNKSNNNASISTSSKVVLSFNDDQDDTKSYEDVVLLSKRRLGEEGEPIPQTFIDGRAEIDTWDRSYDGQNARIVLDLDSHQYNSPAIGNISPRSGMTAEEEYIIVNRERNPRENVMTGGRLTAHLSSEGHLDSHDDSISNYNDSVSSADIFTLPKSEIDGHASDSDISDNAGSFHATFEPRTNDDEENDSGITLVSYQNKKSPEHQRRVDQRGAAQHASLVASGGGASKDTRAFPVSPRVVELQQQASPSPSHSPSPPPLPHSTPPEGLPGREFDSSDSAGEGWHSPQVQRALRPGAAASASGHVTNQRVDPQINVIADSSGALIYDSSWEPKSGETADHIVLQPHGASREGQHYTMDPITGLKRTGVVSPTDKAMVFMHSTEPVIRVKKKEDGINPALEEERETILEEMKVRTKKAETWLPEDELPRQGEKTESERAYEERRVNLKEQGEKYTIVQPQQSALRYQAAQPKKPGKC